MPTKIKLTILTEDIICHTNSGLNIRIMLNFRIFLVSIVSIIFIVSIIKYLTVCSKLIYI